MLGGWWVSLALAAPELSSDRLVDGRLSGRRVKDDAEVVLLVTGEQRGELGPCGCSVDPTGGLPRTVGYASWLARSGPAPWLIQAGDWADTTLGDEVAVSGEALERSRQLLAMLERAQVGVIHITAADLPVLPALGVPARAVSTNLRAEGLTLPRSQLLDQGGPRVRVLGVSGSAIPFLQPSGFQVEDPVLAVQQVLAERPTESALEEVVVVLAWRVGSQAKALADLPGVDLVVEADDFTGRYAPVQGDSAVWVRTAARGQRATELRLNLAEGELAALRERWIDLDELVPAPAWARRAVAKPAEPSQGADSPAGRGQSGLDASAAQR